MRAMSAVMEPPVLVTAIVAGSRHITVNVVIRPCSRMRGHDSRTPRISKHRSAFLGTSHARRRGW